MRGLLMTGIGALLGYLIGMVPIWRDEARRRAERSKQA